MAPSLSNTWTILLSINSTRALRYPSFILVTHNLVTGHLPLVLLDGLQQPPEGPARYRQLCPDGRQGHPSLLHLHRGPLGRPRERFVNHVAPAKVFRKLAIFECQLRTGESTYRGELMHYDRENFSERR